MKLVEPSVKVIARPEVNWTELAEHLEVELGVSPDWLQRRSHEIDAEILIEFMARKCYRSFEPGLNRNVTKVRTDRADYFENILESRHGSVLAHAHFSFIFHNVSRVFTHEIVRHSAGTDISQESLRYVRLDDISFWMPQWAQEDTELSQRGMDLVRQMEEFQKWMAIHFKLDDEGIPFHEKKHKTSFMRRFAPEGLATSMGMTFNVRALRHVLETRYSGSAEEEMQVVMPQLYRIMTQEMPLLFCDYEVVDGSIQTKYRKV